MSYKVYEEHENNDEVQNAINDVSTPRCHVIMLVFSSLFITLWLCLHFQACYFMIMLYQNITYGFLSSLQK